MPKSNDPITETIKLRFSCRDYRREPVNANKLQQLHVFIEALPPGPFGSRPRFGLLAATEADSKSLRGLGTYGFIKNPSAFITGAMTPAEYDLEDFGYLMESIILHATSLDLGTCWLGGTFTKNRFAGKMALSARETIPAVAAMGEYVISGQERRGVASQTAGSDRRLPWEALFSNAQTGMPLTRNEAGDYAAALELVRLGPSASNKQPWRIRKHDRLWQFYLERTPGYRNDLIKQILDLCDLQRLDMGIAMCHFELTANELGLSGRWVVEGEPDKQPEAQSEYLVSWESHAEKADKVADKTAIDDLSSQP